MNPPKEGEGEDVVPEVEVGSGLRLRLKAGGKAD